MIDNLTVRSMCEEDIPQVATIHSQGFPRHLLPKDWILCNFRAYPRMLYFVAEQHAEIRGYIQWAQRGGFRKQVILELEHLAVSPEHRKRGIGGQLIRESLQQVRLHLAERDAEIKHVLVSTRADNEAQKLYRGTLGAEVEFTIPDLYSADEVYMIARHISRDKEAKSE